MISSYPYVIKFLLCVVVCRILCCLYGFRMWQSLGFLCLILYYPCLLLVCLCMAAFVCLFIIVCLLPVLSLPYACLCPCHPYSYRSKSQCQYLFCQVLGVCLFMCVAPTSVSAHLCLSLYVCPSLYRFSVCCSGSSSTWWVVVFSCVSITCLHISEYEFVFVFLHLIFCFLVDFCSAGLCVALIPIFFSLSVSLPSHVASICWVCDEMCVCLVFFCEFSLLWFCFRL